MRFEPLLTGQSSKGFNSAGEDRQGWRQTEEFHSDGEKQASKEEPREEEEEEEEQEEEDEEDENMEEPSSPQHAAHSEEEPEHRTPEHEDNNSNSSDEESDSGERQLLSDLVSGHCTLEFAFCICYCMDNQQP